MDCKNHEMVFVKRLKSDGNKLLSKQCLSCGDYSSKAYRLTDVNNFDALPEYSQSAWDYFRQRQQQEWQDDKENEKQDWFKNEYGPYLQSKEWAVKRAAVLKRDNYLCQACLTRTATQVHHLTYRHVFNEPLFDLTSVCAPCHDKITNLDRGSE